MGQTERTMAACSRFGNGSCSKDDGNINRNSQMVYKLEIIKFERMMMLQHCAISCCLMGIKWVLPTGMGCCYAAPVAEGDWEKWKSSTWAHQPLLIQFKTNHFVAVQTPTHGRECCAGYSRVNLLNGDAHIPIMKYEKSAIALNKHKLHKKV